MYKVYKIKKRIFDDNDQEADKVRKELKENGTFLINLMSSPGRREDDHPEAHDPGAAG